MPTHANGGQGNFQKSTSQIVTTGFGALGSGWSGGESADKGSGDRARGKEIAEYRCFHGLGVLFLSKSRIRKKIYECLLTLSTLHESTPL